MELKPTIRIRPDGGSIMAIAAHPDDIESWCAGTLALASDAGSIVRLLLVTSGEHGASDPSTDPAELAAQRESEARAAAAVLGLTDVQFLHYPDGNFENGVDLRRDLTMWIRRWQPDILFTHDPEFPYPPYLTHRDHRIVGRAALDAVYPLARDVLSFPDLVQAGLTPHAVREVWLFSSMNTHVHVDITASFERKIVARLKHESQTTDPVELEKTWRTRAHDIGVPVGLELAEAFVVLQV